MPKQNEKNLNSENDHGKTLFSWTFPEFIQHQRTKSWYITAGIIVAILIAWSIFTANFLFAVVVIMSALLILMFHRSANQIEFKIAEDGILVNNIFYNYDQLKNFYVIYQPPEVKSLFFEPKNILKPRIPISLEDQNPVKIRETLLNYLSEDLDRENEPTSEQFSRLLKL